MLRVYAVVEGPSEEAFIKRVLSPALWPSGVHLEPILLKKAGGDPRWVRAKGDVTKLLKEERRRFVTTMFDLYGLGTDWPGRPASPMVDGITAAATIEATCTQSLADELDDDLQVADRFLPHIQPFEFEGLLFSRPESLAQSLPAPNLATGLAAVRASFPTPEHINDSPQSAPSKRLKAFFHAYDKVLYAAVAAQAVGIPAMRAECPHSRGNLETP